MTEPDISSVDAWEVLDSRGHPTVACEVRLSDGTSGIAAVPSGASTGRYEAHELRDGGSRYAGRGVLKAVENVRGEIAVAITGHAAFDQVALDSALRRLDGTANLERLGANAVLAVSVANARACATSKKIPLWSLFTEEPLLPLPMVNIFSGGAHAGGIIDIQDILIVPVGAESFSQALEWATAVRASTGAVLASLGHNISLVADEGGFAVPVAHNREAIELLVRGIEVSGLTPGNDAAIAIDIAANQFQDGDGYYLKSENRRLNKDELLGEIQSWCDAFPIVSLEDVFADDDWGGWSAASQQLPDVQLLGDDLFATDINRLERGIAEHVANAVLVKPNQIGTLSDAARVVERAKSAGYATVVSARSGETEDSWLADLAVGWRSGQIKVGSTTRSERTAKWNRLLRIELELGARARYAGAKAIG
jgi:enolase